METTAVNQEQKKLLILGGNYTECEIVKAARQLGYYTIVTDNHEDWRQSPAKQDADEGWNISWSDIDALYSKCIEEHVKGVIAGFSEFRMENMIKLCSKLKIPCPLTTAQLSVTRDKIKFKQICREYGVPCIKDYSLCDSIEFPVIIKPVDRAGSIGINIARDNEELRKYYDYALGLSPSKQVIIEDYIEDGTKVDVYYFVAEGEITLLGTSDTVMCEGDLGAKILQKAWTFPSAFEVQYKRELDGIIKNMLAGLGVKFGYVTISTFYYHNSFYVFETGFRLSGDMSYNYYRAQTGIDYMESLIKYAMDDYQHEHYREIDKPSCSVILNFFGKNGKIKRIDGLEKIASIPSVIAQNLFVREGDVIANKTNVFKKVAMFSLFSNDSSEVFHAVKQINDSFQVIDECDADLVYERVSMSTLKYLDKTTLPIRLKSETGGITSYRIVPKPHFISYWQVQKLLNSSHSTNQKKGLHYATAGQSLNVLKKKLENSVCLVALKDDGSIIATGAIQFREINHWYHHGQIGLLKLLGVSPQYRGNGVADKLLKARLFIAQSNGVSIVVSDSAEQNEAVRHLYLSNGFQMVDSCLYGSNNFYSVVYAKWFSDCPWSKTTIRFYYAAKRLFLHLKYKPGKIPRFAFWQ